MQKSCTKGTQQLLEKEINLTNHDNKFNNGVINSSEVWTSTLIDLMSLQDDDTILLPNTVIFIFVFTVATKQQHMVNPKLGFVEIFILIFLSTVPE